MIPFQIRPVDRKDIPLLNRMDMGYQSEIGLKVQRISSSPAAVTYTLQPERLPEPAILDYTDWDWAEVETFMAHLQAGGALVLGAFPAGAFPPTGLPAAPAAPAVASAAAYGLLELALDEWNATARLFSLYVHRPVRGHGIGSALLEQALAFAREHGARAVWADTPSTNFPAIQFYLARGFAICGLHDHLYSNSSLSRHEVAIYLCKEL
ncbi:MAG: GNAT family N-acetyltransferase [Firmicutes bacterium]|nr:GNAT family N-acetyltransferase [Bacillota bacterium]